MKNFTTSKISIVMMITTLAVILMANFQPLTQGYTGAPGETTCNSCHTIPNEAIRGDVELQGMPAYVVGGHSYPLTLVVHTTNTVAQTAGFQLTMLDDNGTSHGILTDSDAHVEIKNMGNRQYAQHAPAVHFFQGDVYDTIRFDFTWTPSSVNQPQTVNSWYATLLGNGNYQQPGGQRNDSVFARSAQVTVVPELTASISTLNEPTCFGSADGGLEIEVTGGLAPVQVEWSNGATTPAIFGLTAGTYAVTVEDAMGQVIQTEYTLDQPPGLSAEPQIIAPSCHNSGDGVIDLFIEGGTPPYAMYLNSAFYTVPALDLLPGEYQLELFDDRGCMVAIDVVITAPSPIAIVDMEVNHQSSGSTGSIIMEVTGGTPAYEFYWEGPDQYVGFSQNPVNLQAGTYYVTITDENDCTYIDSAVVDFISAINAVENSLSQITISPNPGPSQFMLHFPTSHDEELNITVYAQDGREVFSEVITPSRTYVCEAANHWEPGVYVIQLGQPGTTVSRALRWIKSKV